MEDKSTENGPVATPDDVEIIHRINRLKRKVAGEGFEGSGFISSKSMDRAQAVIDNSQVAYMTEMGSLLSQLRDAWKTLKEFNSDNLQEEIDDVYRYANRILDMASTYSYYLMEYFGKSLRDFCENLDAKRTAHQTIVQAHIDVMMIAFHEKLKAEDTPKAEELKLILGRAISKYS